MTTLRASLPGPALMTQTADSAPRMHGRPEKRKGLRRLRPVRPGSQPGHAAQARGLKGGAKIDPALKTGRATPAGDAGIASGGPPRQTGVPAVARGGDGARDRMARRDGGAGKPFQKRMAAGPLLPAARTRARLPGTALTMTPGQPALACVRQRCAGTSRATGATFCKVARRGVPDSQICPVPEVRSAKGPNWL